MAGHPNSEAQRAAAAGCPAAPAIWFPVVNNAKAVLRSSVGNQLEMMALIVGMTTPWNTHFWHSKNRNKPLQIP